MNLSKNAITVLEKRYLKKDIDGKIIETPEELFKRVAKHIATPEVDYRQNWEEKFFNLMYNLDFLPNTPCLVNADREDSTLQLNACFVLPVEDSIEGIFDAVKNMALVQKSGGGTGFDFSKLRPANSVVRSSMGIASGVVSFMKIFNAATEQMKQGGVRRGANMGILRCDHPEILEFLAMKEKEGEFSNFNISIAITDEFMRCLKTNEDFELKHEKVKEVTKINPKYLWDKIIEGAHRNGEPGIVFIDTINNLNPLKDHEVIEATNPCGEQPLPQNGSCNLGSINLSNSVKDNDIDYSRLETVIQTSVRFLDNVISVNKYPLPEIKEESIKTRRIGLGVMGFADMLIKLKINYNSEKAIHISETLAKFINKVAYKYSEKLFKEKGNENSKILKKLKGRNGTLLTIAPTGGLSLIANCSSGIEPNFDIEFDKIAVDTTLSMIPPLFIPYISNKENMPSYFVTTRDIPLKQHIDIQSAWQKHVCNAISKTINCPNSTKIEQINEATLYAYDKKVKGLTFYREGSRSYEALSSKKSKVTKPKFGRPTRLIGFTEKMKTGLGNVYITLNTDESGDPRETFVSIGKAGNDLQAMCEALGRLLSLIFKKGMCDVKEVIKQLKGIGGESVVFQNGEIVKSIPDAIGKFLEREFMQEKDNNIQILLCPECQSKVVVQEGCPTCYSCGWKGCNG